MMNFGYDNFIIILLSFFLVESPGVKTSQCGLKKPDAKPLTPGAR